jgi:photosystem II stability/assembly factor-like uncharacterized protein
LRNTSKRKAAFPSEWPEAIFHEVAAPLIIESRFYDQAYCIEAVIMITRGVRRKNLTVLALFTAMLGLLSPILIYPARDFNHAPDAAFEQEGIEQEAAEQEAADERLSPPLSYFNRLSPDARLRLIREEYEKYQAAKANDFSALAVEDGRWTSLGPTNGAGKITAIAFHPSSPDIIYVGSHGGGVWKSVDAGSTWVPLTDSIPMMRVGALAIAPSSPETIYLGSLQIGVLKSTDAGVTWGLPGAVISGSSVNALSVHPQHPNEVLAGTFQGAFKTTDGGASWKQVIPEPSSVYDIERDPTAPQIIYATTGALGPSRILKSFDGGETWNDKSAGLLVAQTGFTPRIALAISQSNPLTLYATAPDTVANDSKSRVYKSTNGGEFWTDLPAVSNSSIPGIYNFHSAAGGNQANGNNAIDISPTDPNKVVAGGIVYIRTTDGGATWDLPSFARDGMHVDALDIKYRGSTLWIGNDGGLWSSRDHGNTTVSHNNTLVTREYYTIAINDLKRDRIVAGSQDNGSDMRADAGGTSWNQVAGGDGFDCAINSQDPSIAYATSQLGVIYRTKAAGGPSSFWASLFIPGMGNEPRSFSTVLRMDPKNPATLYTGTYRVWKTTDGGDTWAPLPITTTDGTEWRTDERIQDIAVAPGDSRVLAVNLGNRLMRTTDGGATWVTRPTGFASFRLEIDPANADIIYSATVISTLTEIRAAVYASEDGGRNWALRDLGLPNLFANVVRVDPLDTNILYCGTGVGVYRSTNKGESWSRFGSGLPNVDVRDLQVFSDGSGIRISTFGRGVWQLQRSLIEIASVTVKKKKLFVFGSNFDDGAEILINDQPQKTRNDGDNPTTKLNGPKAGKKIKPGDRIRVRNSDGALSDEFIYAPSNQALK